MRSHMVVECKKLLDKANVPYTMFGMAHGRSRCKCIQIQLLVEKDVRNKWNITKVNYREFKDILSSLQNEWGRKFLQTKTKVTDSVGGGFIKKLG